MFSQMLQLGTYNNRQTMLHHPHPTYVIIALKIRDIHEIKQNSSF